MTDRNRSIAYPDAWGSAEAANPGACGGSNAADDTGATTARGQATATDTVDVTATDDSTARRIRRGVRNVIPMPKRTAAP